MKVFIVQRPTKSGWRNVAAYFKKGEARTHCVPNFDDRIVEGDMTFTYPCPTQPAPRLRRVTKSSLAKSKRELLKECELYNHLKDRDVVVKTKKLPPVMKWTACATRRVAKKPKRKAVRK